MTLLTILGLNFPKLVTTSVAVSASVATASVVAFDVTVASVAAQALTATTQFSMTVPICGPIVVDVTPAPGTIFGPGDQLVRTQGVLIPPLLNLTTASQASDPNIEQVYYLLRRLCTAFPPAIQLAIEPIRAKVASTQDISLLTADDITLVHTLNNLYNTDATDTFITTSIPAT